jgi:hypothetical protein
MSTRGGKAACGRVWEQRAATCRLLLKAEHGMSLHICHSWLARE